MIRFKTLILLALVAATTPRASAQAIVTVVPHSGSQQQITLSASGQIYFTSDHMLILDGSENGAMQSFAMANVQSVRFSNPVSITHVDESPSLTLAPNPTCNRLTINGCGDGTCNLRIYAIDGSLALSTTCRNGQPIDIQPLPAGTYLVRAGNGVAKFIKH